MNDSNTPAPECPSPPTPAPSGSGHSPFLGYLGIWVVGYFLIVSPLDAQTPAAGGDGAPELTAEASRAIDKGLEHLLAAQKKDGSWDSDGQGGQAVACTSLSLMAFMGKAQFPGFGPYGEQLDRGMKWLLKEAKKRPDGYLGTVMYEHGFATLALSEMWGMVRDPEDDDAIKEALEKAAEVILRSQSPSGGWHYQPQADAGQDTSCTQTVFHALASAHQAGIVVPNATIAKVVKYLEGACDRQTGAFRYNVNVKSLACTGGGAYIAQLVGQRDTEMVNAAIRHLKSQSPGIFSGGQYYYYAHYYAIQAMVQAGDEEYVWWYPKIRDELIKRQNAQGGWGTATTPGTISYETPMAIIILSTPHRYIPIYQR